MYDTTWKDKLIKYNGTTITYDAMGNPLSYRDGMSFTWANGRRLNSVTVGNTTLNMKYDSNGMRTQKGNIHYYYDSDNNLIALINGNKTLFFYYDENSLYYLQFRYYDPSTGRFLNADDTAYIGATGTV